jgi:hypothetical protein
MRRPLRGVARASRPRRCGRCAPGADAGAAAGPAHRAVGGTIHTVTNGVIENGTILFEDGRITAIGTRRPASRHTPSASMSPASTSTRVSSTPTTRWASSRSAVSTSPSMSTSWATSIPTSARTSRSTRRAGTSASTRSTACSSRCHRPAAGLCRPVIRHDARRLDVGADDAEAGDRPHRQLADADRRLRRLRRRPAARLHARRPGGIRRSGAHRAAVQREHPPAHRSLRIGARVPDRPRRRARPSRQRCTLRGADPGHRGARAGDHPGERAAPDPGRRGVGAK